MWGRDPRERAHSQLNAAFEKQNQRIQQLERQLAMRSQQPFLPPSHSGEEDEKFRDHEHRYANTILLLGYGGFFALWSSTAGHMPKILWGWSGLFICISLLFFILFELAKTAAGSSALTFFAKSKEPPTPSEQTTIVNRRIDAVNRFWPLVFGVSTMTGLIAGGIVVWCFATHALGHDWPVSTPAPSKPIQQSAPAKDPAHVTRPQAKA
jgi:hypothetical protein